MAARFQPTPQDMPRTQIEALPAFKLKDCMNIASQIASHLKRILQHQASDMACLNLPSAMELAEFYHCSALDVLDGLYHLKNQSYEYAMNGLDSEIILYGPIAGHKPVKPLPEWLYPWERAHKVTENPIITLFQTRT